MKLFVWYGDGVLEQKGNGLAAAMAPDIDTARKLLRQELLSKAYAKDGDLTFLYRDPDETHDTPAVVFAWGSE